MAGLQVACGASLLAMVSRLTTGKKRFEHVEEQLRPILMAAEELRDRAWGLALQDAAAYGRVATAMKLPRQMEAEREMRRRALQSSLKEAVEPPLDTMRAASQVMALASELVQIGNPSAISDVGVAASSARAGWLAASLNVEINLASVDDAIWRKSIEEQLQALPDLSGAEEAILQRVRATIRGERG